MSEQKTILVADDSETITTLLSTALRSKGYLVKTASSGLEAFEMGRTESFDLILIDQLMPGLLGLEVIEKWHLEGLQPEVMVLTGVDDERIVVDSFDLGAADFVRKPFRLPELLARIERRLES